MWMMYYGLHFQMNQQYIVINDFDRFYHHLYENDETEFYGNFLVLFTNLQR